MVTSAQNALNETYALLEELLNSSLLDLSTEASDCLEVFDQYEWQVKTGCDEKRFQQLKEKGDAGTMSVQELKEFMGMVSKDGQYHVYLTIHEGHKAIRKHREQCVRDPVEEYKVVAMSRAHLTEEDRDLLVEAVNDADQMVLQSETGFFIKLFKEETASNYRYGHSETIKDIIRWAHESGYRMIEFDSDAAVLTQFPVFEW